MGKETLTENELRLIDDILSEYSEELYELYLKLHKKFGDSYEDDEDEDD